MFFLGLIGDANKAQLGQIHQSLGDWIGAQALALLRKAMIEPADIDLVGCQAFLLPGGLALGDLARASQASGLIITPVTLPEGKSSAEMGAYAAWQLWRKNCQPATAKKLAVATEVAAATKVADEHACDE